ncbi:PstS family phosphate ABC transporter substrate-binding protein [Oscillatoria sp. CS-180]|uniref:PstS family phosphate ABC transporter substrate-binding protein n=1 Tax=Oscillatoria sp. CS-180 TaxID=3021720 RepID=UPI002330402B|nr:PstS family phosphate ABC transporter substrate-binding protein [Oscillatoria sp. CS-180]MDB9526196.1 PstS family phosphate ABC transporter substrate-binding protein [Oscillatoria sp. CS-180]
MFANGIKVAGAFAIAATVGLGTSASAQVSGDIAIDGSSTVFPISEAMAEEFMAENPDARVTVGVSGTGGGFRKFCAGETDISNASRPVKQEELDACAENGIEPIELLVGTDALTVVVDQDNDWLTAITSDELNKIWAPEAEGTVTRWNQVNADWPNQPIRLFGPGTDSGTFDFFTDEINGEEGASRADYTASEDDNILVLGVSRDPNALGYFGLAYFLENDDELRALPVDGVEPTPENAKSGDYSLARPLYIYVNPASLDEPQVRAFVEYYLETARDTDIITEVGYVPLEENAYDDDLEIIGAM